MTAGTLPSIGEVVRGLVSRLATAHLRNKVLAQEAGDEFNAALSHTTAGRRSCGHRGASLDGLPICARCDSADVELSGGDELVVESRTFDGAREEAADVPRDPG